MAHGAGLESRPQAGELVFPADEATRPDDTRHGFGGCHPQATPRMRRRTKLSDERTEDRGGPLDDHAF